MILFIPENKVCPDKTTTYRVTNHKPVLWIKTENPDYSAITVDGFVMNNQRNVRGIFKKLEYIAERDNEEITLDHITEVIAENELKVASQLAKIFQCDFLFLYGRKIIL